MPFSLANGSYFEAMWNHRWEGKAIYLIFVSGWISLFNDEVFLELSESKPFQFYLRESPILY